MHMHPIALRPDEEAILKNRVKFLEDQVKEIWNELNAVTSKMLKMMDSLNYEKEV